MRPKYSGRVKAISYCCVEEVEKVGVSWTSLNISQCDTWREPRKLDPAITTHVWWVVYRTELIHWEMKCERVEARRTGAGNQFGHLVWKIWWKKDLASFAQSICLSKGLLFYELLCWASFSLWRSSCFVMLKPVILPYVKASSTERPLCWPTNRTP